MNQNDRIKIWFKGLKIIKVFKIFIKKIYITLKKYLKLFELKKVD